jgi:hypothetical protein
MGAGRRVRAPAIALATEARNSANATTAKGPGSSPQKQITLGAGGQDWPGGHAGPPAVGKGHAKRGIRGNARSNASPAKKRPTARSPRRRLRLAATSFGSDTARHKPKTLPGSPPEH